MREFKKYPNRRLYDVHKSRYVTIEDIRKIILGGETISVVDSRTDKDLTRSVLLQIVAEQENEEREPILTNTVLEQLIRTYGNKVRGVMGNHIEQSIVSFLNHHSGTQQNPVD
jgi:polyhydroxyalkanoate synthesis repressor PhaR